jgi:chromosome partitioning protein
MRTIAVIARKGGSGKTTVAVHLAIAAHLAGRATLVADTDPQTSAVEVFGMRKTPGPQCLASTPQALLDLQIRSQAAGVEAMLIDTPAGTEEGMSNAIVLADLSLLVIRPTFLDIAAAVYTTQVLRKLRKPGIVILNQAPVSRDGVEPPAVKKALEALAVMRMHVAPVILRSRASYQTTIESGRSAVEMSSSPGAVQELSQLWDYIERFAFSAKDRPTRAEPSVRREDYRPAEAASFV